MGEWPGAIGHVLDMYGDIQDIIWDIHVIVKVFGTKSCNHLSILTNKYENYMKNIKNYRMFTQGYTMLSYIVI